MTSLSCLRIHTGHTELGGISGAILSLTQSSPFHHSILNRGNLPALTFFGIVAHILPTRTKQHAINKIFGHGVHIGYPLTMIVLSVIDKVAVS